MCVYVSEIPLESLFEKLKTLMTHYQDILSGIAEKNGLKMADLSLELDEAPYYFTPQLRFEKDGQQYVLDQFEFGIQDKEFEMELEEYGGVINRCIGYHPEYLQPIKERFAAECERIGVRCLS